MNKYYDSLNDETKEYFNILSPEFPEWLYEYIDTPEMKRIGKIGISCGADYSKCFDVKYWYSNLDHSVGVALIIWNFTHDKKQTLSGLFHDIATPTFKHCIDIMNGDCEKQESTEERTTSIIKNSNKIMKLLKRDNIKLSEVDNYKIYPIADNDIPKLSADRFEYTFSSGLIFHRVWELNKIREIYNNVVISKNEDGIDEFAFKDKEVCEEYIKIIRNLWPAWVDNKDRAVMKFFADMCKSMNVAGFLTVDDLYNLSEKEVIEKMKNCKDEYLSNAFKKFQLADRVYDTEGEVKDKYCINIKAKTRYVNPLVQKEDNDTIRINKISKQASDAINSYLNINKSGYTYFDFDFKPY